MRKSTSAKPSETKPATLSRAELAKALKRDRSSVRRWIQRGVLVPNADGRFELAKASAAIEAARVGTAGPGRGKVGKLTAAGAQDAGAGGPGADGEDKRLIYWRTKTERETFLKRRLERLEASRALVRRGAVERAWAEQATQVRDQLLQLGPRLAGRLAAETDPRVCSQLVTDEVLVTLRAIAAGEPTPGLKP